MHTYYLPQQHSPGAAPISLQRDGFHAFPGEIFILHHFSEHHQGKKIKRGGIKKKRLNAKKIPKVNSNFLQTGRKQHFATERSRQLLSLGEDMWAVKYLPWQRVHESQQLPVSSDIEHANYPPKFRLDSCYLTPLSTQYGMHLAWNWFLFSHHKHWKWIGRLY